MPDDASSLTAERADPAGGNRRGNPEAPQYEEQNKDTKSGQRRLSRIGVQWRGMPPATSPCTGRLRRSPESMRERSSMARTGPNSIARRTLVWLGVMLAAGTVILGGGIITGHASWAPKLALDLEGGTQMILAPKVEGGRRPSPVSSSTRPWRSSASALTAPASPKRRSAPSPGATWWSACPASRTSATRELIQASADMEFRPVLTTAAPARLLPRRERTPGEGTAEADGQAGERQRPQLDHAGRSTRQFEALDCARPGPGRRQRLRSGQADGRLRTDGTRDQVHPRAG